MNEETTDRPWYKKKRYIIPAIATGLFLIGTVGNNTPTSQQTRITPLVQQQDQVGVVGDVKADQNLRNINVQFESTKAPAASGADLSNNNTYVNTYGNTVHSPAYSNSGSVPAGATARCRDGTYSFSQSRRGTCSHHGGVSEWNP